jgi:hypothetical protein
MYALSEVFWSISKIHAESSCVCVASSGPPSPPKDNIVELVSLEKKLESVCHAYGGVDVEFSRMYGGDEVENEDVKGRAMRSAELGEDV